MNSHTASEHAAAAKLRDEVRTLVAGYSHPADAGAARIGALMLALENEAKAQGRKRFAVFLRRTRRIIDKQSIDIFNSSLNKQE